MKLPTNDEIAERTEALALEFNKVIPDDNQPIGIVLGACAVLIGTAIGNIENIVDKSEALNFCDSIIRKLAFAPRLNS